MDMELGYTLSMLNIRTPQLFKKQMVTLALISVFMVKHRLKAPTLIRKFDISLWFPCGAYGLAYGQVITKISRIRHLHISHNAPFLSPLPPPPPKKINFE